jgi:RNA 2',3'-cyclic 3'-phosphodiesterase
MKRTFIAIPIEPVSENTLSLFKTFKDSLDDEKIKWVNPRKFHITLAFLGDTDQGSIIRVGALLKQVSESKENFTIKLQGAGIFTNLRNPRVIWFGIKNYEIISEMKSELDLGLSKLGFEIDKRPFNPHLTIGRITNLKNKSILQQLINSSDNTFLQEIPVSKIIYFESILSPEGPKYIPLAVYNLKI